MIETTERDREMALEIKDGFFRAQGWDSVSLIRFIAHFLSTAREEGQQEERERCAEIARAWIHGAPTTTTERVVQEIVVAIRFGMSEEMSKK